MGKWLSRGVTAGDTRGVKDICVRLAFRLDGPPGRQVTDVLLLLHSSVAVEHVLVLLRGVIWLSVVVLTSPGLNVDTLGSGWHHAIVLLSEEGDLLLLLLLYLPLLLLQLLLLEELNLGIDVGDGIGGGMWGHHGGGYGRMRRSRGHAGHLAVHGSRQQD